jgi:hypothetical protein
MPSSNVLVPERVGATRWTGRHPDPGQPDETLPTGEPLTDLDGSDLRAKYLIATGVRVSRRTPLVRYLTITLGPADFGNRQVVQIRARVQSDDLPDDVDECEAEITVTVDRVRP